MTIAIPTNAGKIIAVLEGHGNEAFVVGGCVRDSLLGQEAHDWDICTNALPQQVVYWLTEAGAAVAETGLQHGTVTVVLDHEHYEVTTYRVESGYSDHRRPDSVAFVGELEADLARRDFTINAMAYSDRTGLVDCFGGQRDLELGVIACVGNPDERFGEDALRIMRALRFAAIYGFAIAPDCAAAIYRLRHTLGDIAVERVAAELVRLLCGAGAIAVLDGYVEVLGTVLPELLPMVGLDQRNPHHAHDLWQHTVRAVAATPPDKVLRLAALLHDIGKPCCATVDDNGIGHFYRHAEHSERLARTILRRLRFDNRTVYEVCELVLYHDATIAPTSRSVRRWLLRLGESRLRQLLMLKAADITAQGTAESRQRLQELTAITDCIDSVIAEGQCFSLRNLEADGSDLVAMGIPKGVAIGRALNRLLDEVLEDRLPNVKESLVSRATELWQSGQLTD